ncbi:hypothetical protein HYX10_02975 [Candidatus Woesearchaeota archaeon]|nr:hypothetical protein [Candidatus Woesearchaeota archaeon]
MNIQDVQKVNKLSKLLVAHNIAASPEDAQQQAEGMVKQSMRMPVQSHEEKMEQMMRSLSAELQNISNRLSRIDKNYAQLQEKLESFKPAEPSMNRIISENASPESSSTINSNESKETAPEQSVDLEKIFYYGKK